MSKSESDKNTQDARKGIDFRHQGGAMCKFWGLGTVDLVSTKNRKFHENFKILDSIQDLVILPFEFRVSKWCPAVI